MGSMTLLRSGILMVFLFCFVHLLSLNLIYKPETECTFLFLCSSLEQGNFGKKTYLNNEIWMMANSPFLACL